MFTPNPLKKGKDIQVETKKVYCCKGRAIRNLIGPYYFWGINPRNSTLLTRPFLTRRHTQAGHETNGALGMEKLSHEQSGWLST